MFQELLLSLELAEKIQYRSSEDVCWLVSLLGASCGQGCEPVGLIQTELGCSEQALLQSRLVPIWIGVSFSFSSRRGIWSQQLPGRQDVKMVQYFITTPDLIPSYQKIACKKSLDKCACFLREEGSLVKGFWFV